MKTGQNDAEVWADGKKAGVGSEVTLTLEQGTRVIDVRHKGKSIFKEKINVLQGLARVVEVDKKIVTPGTPVKPGGTPTVGGAAGAPAGLDGPGRALEPREGPGGCLPGPEFSREPIAVDGG